VRFATVGRPWSEGGLSYIVLGREVYLERVPAPRPYSLKNGTKSLLEAEKHLLFSRMTTFLNNTAFSPQPEGDGIVSDHAIALSMVRFIECAEEKGLAVSELRRRTGYELFLTIITGSDINSVNVHTFLSQLAAKGEDLAEVDAYTFLKRLNSHRRELDVVLQSTILEVSKVKE